MEWVEITAKTIEEATSIALDRLGVAEDDAEVEVLEEPKTGLFGRIRGEARVRARVRPTPARARQDRRERRRRSDRTEGEASGGSSDGQIQVEERRPRERGRRGGERQRPRQQEESMSNEQGNGRNDEGANDRPSARRGRGGDGERESTGSSVDPQQVGEEARKFIAGLVEAFGLSATTTLGGSGSELEVTVEGSDIGLLVGPRGTTLQAVQDLARVASQRRLGDHDTRLRVDVGGYRERRQQALAVFARQMADEVLATGTGRVLEPMGSSDRKAVHDALTEVEGVETRSEGEDPHRRVVILPIS